MSERRSNYARQLLAELVGDRPPLTMSGDCEYCDMDMIFVGDDDRCTDPDEHKTTCRWARAARFLRGIPVDGGVTT